MRQFRNNIGLQTCGNDSAGVIRQPENKTGFTIVELLTVMSIIVILIGLLVPALTMAKRYATDVKQRAQFHGIAVAMQLFNAEFEGYPESDRLDADGLRYCGAMKLCEAMVGQDLLGYHLDSVFRSDLTDNSGTEYLYKIPGIPASVTRTAVSPSASRRPSSMARERSLPTKYDRRSASTPRRCSNTRLRRVSSA